MGEVLHCLARAIIIEDDTILLAHEKQSPNTFLPGGHVEFGDSLISTIERELVEELGLECTVGQYLGAIEHSWSRDSVQHFEINHFFKVNLIGIKPQQTQIQWNPT